MTLNAGARLGPYEIRDRLGAGGMGEVYRAWDARLGREVALKVLPAPLATDPDRLRRFEQEARAAGSLSHPNLVVVYDVGSHDGTPYIVAERLEGETLRDRLSHGALTTRKAVEHAVQIARGLAAAHEHGIVHRDLKPENVFVCRDGAVKILDFGIAKLRGEGAGGPEDETASRLTQPGTIVGTVAYMSPEQVRGAAVDARSDIFSLGVVLYEMLVRRRPFEGETAAELQTAILREEPREVSTHDGRIPAALDRVVRRCLEKRPEDRFDTARDVALSLEAVAGASGESPAAAGPAGGRRRPSTPVLAAVILAAAGLGASLAWHLRPPPPSTSYTQLTFRRGWIAWARFAPEGDTVVYSAAWDGQPARVFTTRPGSYESRDLGIEGIVLAVSAKDELAVKRGPFAVSAERGTLATVSLSGGTPRERLTDVRDADWDPEGRELAVVRVVEERSRLEYPIGRVLYQAAGEILSLRVLPNGRIAVFERLPNGGATPYAVSVVDPRGKKTLLSSGWADPASKRMGWSSSGEVFFAASDGGLLALHAVSLGGRVRTVARVPGDLFFDDVDRRGRILTVRASPRGGVMAFSPGAGQEHDLSWLDFSSAADLSADGRQLLLGDIGGDYTGTGGIALRSTDGSAPVTLGRGGALALSPDGRLVLALPDAVGPGDRLLVIPTGAGERRELRHDSIPRFSDAAFFPDGKHIAVVGGREESRMRLLVWDLDDTAPPRALSPEGRFGRPVAAPDGRWVTALRAGTPLAVYAMDGGPARPFPGGSAEDEPLVWSADGRALFVRRGSGMPAVVERIEVVTGRREPWKVLQPADPAGVFGIRSVVVTPDGRSYAYTFAANLGTLYLAEGWN